MFHEANTDQKKVGIAQLRSHTVWTKDQTHCARAICVLRSSACSPRPVCTSSRQHRYLICVARLLLDKVTTSADSYMAPLDIRCAISCMRCAPAGKLKPATMAELWLSAAASNRTEMPASETFAAAASLCTSAALRVSLIRGGEPDISKLS